MRAAISIRTVLPAKILLGPKVRVKPMRCLLQRTNAIDSKGKTSAASASAYSSPTVVRRPNK